MAAKIIWCSLDLTASCKLLEVFVSEAVIVMGAAVGAEVANV